MCGCSSSRSIIEIAVAAAISLALTASGSLVSVFLVSEAAAQADLERTQIRGLPHFGLVRQDVNDAPQREGDDAVAIGLIGRIDLGDGPYYDYGDYYGGGDFYTPEVPGCRRQFRCRDDAGSAATRHRSAA